MRSGLRFFSVETFFSLGGDYGTGYFQIGVGGGAVVERGYGAAEIARHGIFSEGCIHIACGPGWDHRKYRWCRRYGGRSSVQEKVYCVIFV